MRTHALLATTVLGTILGVTAPRAAADCAGDEKTVLTMFKAFDAAGAAAVPLGVRCMFHGTDAASVAKIEASIKKTMAKLAKVKDPAPACVKGGDPAKAMGVIGNAFGQRVGLAWSLCSADAQAKVAEMGAKGATAADIEAELGKMSEAWLEKVMK